MSLEGSQSAAESRMNQILGRIDDMTSPDASVNKSAPSSEHSYSGQPGPGQVSAKQFKAIASMMQAKMISESFNKPGDNNSSSPFGNMIGGMPGMGGMPGANPMAGMMGMQNPAMMNPMSMMMGGMGQMNPMAAMMGGIPGMNAMPQKAIFPVAGKISSEYGEREHPIHGHQHFHTGLDIAAEQGTAMKMPWDGKVVYVGPVEGFGENTVIVAHENQVQPDGKIIYSVFGHNEYVFVQKGDNVHQGEIFGTVGNDGDSTGSHLHWETRIAPRGLGGPDVLDKRLSYTVDPLKTIV